MRSIQVSKSTKDLFVTGIVSLTVLISIVIVTRLLAQGLGPDKFGAYSLSRTIIKSILTLTTLGMTVALPRYIAFRSDSGKVQKLYIFWGCILVLLVTVVFGLASILLSKSVGVFLFGRAQSDYLLYGTLILLGGHTLHLLTYGIYRGKLQMKYANLLQFLNIGMIPLLVAVFLHRTEAATVLMAMGVGTIVFVCGPFLWNFAKSIKFVRPTLGAEGKELLIYSLPRIPADVGLGLLFLLGPWISARVGEVREAGYFVVGQSVLSVLYTLLEAVGLVSLPYFAKLSGKQEREALRKQVSILSSFAIHLGVSSSIQLLIFADWITILWCGKEYAPAIPYMRIILASAGAYALYVSLRSVIDADEVAAVNTRNIWISLAVGIIVASVSYLFGIGTLALAIGLAAGIGTLGLLSLIYTNRRFFVNVRDYNLGLLLLLNTLMALVALGMKRMIPLSRFAFVYVFLLESVFLITYSLVLKNRHIPWFEAILSRIRIV